MHRLISSEMLERYLVKQRRVNGRLYEAFFEYSDLPVTDMDGMEIAHEVVVGFRDEHGVVRDGCSGVLYLPIVLDNGLLSKNKTTWYRVNMVIPPLVFHGPTGKAISYLNEVVNGDMTASSLDDFIPQAQTLGLTPSTPLMRELTPEVPQDVNDLYTWNVIDIETAVIELFNRKIEDDIKRSQKGGFQGISASIRAVHSLLRAFCRFTEDEEDHGSSDERFFVIPEEAMCLGPISVQDKMKSVVMHELVKSINVRGDSPIDFCSCSQAYPMRTGRMKDGIDVVNHKFSGTPTFPYTTWRRAIFGVLSDDPRRMIVSRGISRALRLDKPDGPLAQTEYQLNVDSLSLPGIRMSHPLNYEDGIVVSETFADKAGGYKMFSEKISVPASASIEICKKPYTGSDYRDILKRISRSRDTGHRVEQDFIVDRHEIILRSSYYDLEGNRVTKEFPSVIKAPAIVARIERFVPATDLDELVMSFRFVYVMYLPLEVGDKVSDGHGNKATISAVLSDLEMPSWTADKGDLTVTAHYIATPYVMKRLAVGAEIEDKLALANYVRDRQGEEIDAYSSDVIWKTCEADEWLDEVGTSYTGTVSFKGKTHKGVPLSLRRMFRLNNNARETLITRDLVRVDEYGRVTNNARMGTDIVTMLARGASILVSQLIEGSGAKTYMRKTVMPVLYAIEGVVPPGAPTFEITRKLDRSLLGNPCSMDIFAKVNVADTVCDPRMMTHYGIIKLGKRTAIVPPHKAVIDLGTGQVSVHRIAVYANRVLTEQMSSDRGYIETTDVSRQEERYKNTLADMLAGKRGILRDALLPVFPTTIRAVATAYVSGRSDQNPLEICLPETEFNRLMRRSPGFRNIYQHKDNWYCILKRDPVHRNNNVIAVRFRLWKHRSIGISPTLIGSLDGDFDGDAVFAMFPVDRDSFEDMKKLIPVFGDIFSASKQIHDATPENVKQLLLERVGWASTFSNPHPSDALKNPALFDKLMRGIEMGELMDETVKAARDFEIIKDGTSRTGALGLSFIFSRKPDQKHLLNSAMELYHVMAQNTLDAKAGVEQPSLHVVEGVRKGNRQMIVEGLDQLGFVEQETRDEFVTFAKSVRDRGGRLRFLTSSFPVLGIIQRGASIQQAFAVAKRLTRHTTMGDGVWEAMMDYLLGRTERSPYEWTERELVKAQRMDGYLEMLKHKWSV